ncbi:hypothetical protein [Embleya sp. NPDC059259]|uniref:hypothetical protein n=1 Tax=unclassified Embleya TaxID=2699296 RepID=UPI00368C6F84
MRARANVTRRIGTVRRHSWTRGDAGTRPVVTAKRSLRPTDDDPWPAVDPVWTERTLPGLLDDAGIPHYRRHGVLFDHPAVAAHVVRIQLAADLEELRRGYATARLWCTENGLPPQATEELLTLYATLGRAQRASIDRAIVWA